jgi:hypothetical protein
MADLQALESANGNPRQGGVLVTFPSGERVELAWDHGAPMLDVDVLGECKRLAARLIEHLSRKALHDDLERTNWASIVAALQRIVTDWNDKLKAATYAQGAAQQGAPVVH